MPKILLTLLLPNHFGWKRDPRLLETDQRFVMKVAIIITIIASVVLANGPDDCPRCLKGMALFGEYAFEDNPLDRQFAVLTDTFCLDLPDPAACGEQVVKWWPEVLKALVSDGKNGLLMCQGLMQCVHRLPNPEL